MIKNTFTEEEKQLIANKIKTITDDEARTDFRKLCKYDFSTINLSNVGNKSIDKFTFIERLNTIGNRNFNYYDLWTNRNLHLEKPYIQKFVKYYEGKNITEESVWLRVMQMYHGSINLFRPTVSGNIYTLFSPKCVLDPTMGWGGRLIGAMATNVPEYIGIDNNINLQQPYRDMEALYKPLTTTNTTLIFQDALTVDYSKLNYDMVLTSPPYYNLEKYGNNIDTYKTKKEWNTLFYTPLFKMTYDGMSEGGHYCLNVPKDIYDKVCIPLFGEATQLIELKKVQRKNGYKEFIYVWVK